ncbi:MAG: Mrp/NBP35 family ATP-binding protein [Acidimicrobiia bacterium]
MAINSEVESARSDHAAPPSPDDVMAILRGVIDPELGSDIVDLGMARKVLSHPNGIVEITVALTTPGCPLRAQIQRDIKARVESLPGVEKVKIHWDTLNAEEKAVTMSRARQLAQSNAPDTMIPATTKVVGVASGKGGVGKSSVTVNIAVAIASMGYRVGVMDADIWGFSVPRMLGVSGRLEGVKDQVVEPGARPKIAPITLPMGEGSLEVVSMGLMVDDEEIALMWRGLMLNRAVQHFLEDVQWHSKLDYLFIDMPPGTGDVAMGLARMLPRVELLVVTTPSLTAQKVAIRAANMARRSHIRVAGVIENMSYFVCDHGDQYPLFGEGGGELLAHDAGVPLLGKIPLEPQVATGGDHGNPVALGVGPAAEAFRALAERLVTETVPPIEMSGCSARLLDSVNAALDALDFD